MAKQHELLAVEADAQGQYKNILAETRKVFKTGNLFQGSHKKLEMFQDDGIEHPVERSEMATTVFKRLNYNNETVSKYFDILIQKESTNQVAVADIMVDNVAIAEKIPVTFLLGMESRLRELRSVYLSIPTLDQGIRWELDEGEGEGVWRASHTKETIKTMMTFKSQILYDAKFPTEGQGGNSQPAQIEKWEEQVPVGKYVQTLWSGMITPAEKSKYLGKIDILIAAVKKARQRANSTKVVDAKIGKTLIDFIHE